jgi:hypothetical protein
VLLSRYDLNGELVDQIAEMLQGGEGEDAPLCRVEFISQKQ